ncbi:MAG: DUF3108 domain-containing protein [Elusimicrobia bacterium]|nr:DUF3108 domain-containing protein [Elusimicrobiota bacterium]
MMRLAPLVLAAAAAPAWAVDLSNPTVADPHLLVGSTIPAQGSYRRLTVFPEQLTYDVSWGLIGVGQATLEAADLVDFDGKPAYRILSRAVSNGFCDTFYKVRDLNESWIDATTLTSLAYSKKLREGHFVRDEWVTYDTGTRRFLARWVGKDNNYSVRTGTIPASVQDILSSLYYIRSQNLVPGSDVTLDVNTKDNWPLMVRVVRKERVRTPAGTFEAILVEPGLRQEGLFIQKGKKLQVWLSDDDKKIPVMMKVEVFFGHVSAKLAKML